MKLFLHWLRWDLRRFQGMLWLWILGVAGYAALLWNLNADLQFAPSQNFIWTKPLGITLLVMEAIMLFRLFGSDACGGTAPQWKTRPPAGWAVGLSKIAIAVTFYLVLPLLAWWLILTTTGNGEVMLSNSGATWMHRLWWVQALLIAACLLECSAAQSGWNMAGRILALVLIVGAVPWIRGMTDDSGWSLTAALKSCPPVLWLAVALAAHLFCRVRRTPGLKERVTTLLAPGLLALGGNTLPFLPGPKPSWQLERPLSEPLASRIRIGEPLLHTGQGEVMGYRSASGEDLVGFPLTLHLDGLPDDCRASGFWQEITLTTPDGKTIRCIDLKERQDKIKIERPVGWNGTHKVITTAGASFRSADLKDAGLTKCRLKGVLRITVEQRREQTFPFRPGAVMQGPAGHIRVDKIASLAEVPSWGGSGDRLLTGAILTSEMTEEAWWWLEHRQHKTAVPFRMRQDRPVEGWFVEPRLTPMTADAANSDLRVLPVLRLRSASTGGTLAEWDFKTGWYERLGFTDVAVGEVEFVIPLRSLLSDMEAERMDRLFPVLAGSESDKEMRSVLKYALSLDNFAMSGEEHTGHAGSKRLRELLGRLQKSSLQVLLGLLRDEFPYYSVEQNALCARLALEETVTTFLTPADVEAVKMDPVLMHFLRDNMGAKGLITKEEAAVPPDASGWTSEKLQSIWLAGTDNNAARKALGEAVRRGLPWVPEALGELAGYRPLDVPFMLYHAALEMARHSDFPKIGNETDTDWLRTNGASIRWDATAKRWVLPAKR